jgi:hypothetical protein
MALNPFKSDPVKRHEKELAAKIAERDNVNTILKSTEASLPGLALTVGQLMRAGADAKELNSAEANLDAANKRMIKAGETLSEVATEIAAIEQQLAALADEKLRAETAAEIERRADKLEVAGKQIDVAFQQLVSACRDADQVVLDGAGLTKFAENAATEIQPTVAMVARELRGRAAATLAGNAPAALRTAPLALVPQPQPETPKLERFFTLWAVKFVDASGVLRRAPQFVIVELSPAQAERGLASGDVCRIDDPRVAKHRNARTGSQQLPRPEHCHSLDGVSDIAYEPPQQQPVFEKVDRGPGFTMRVPSQPAVAARDADITTDQPDEEA